MSSWDRARYIPWNRIPLPRVDEPDVDAQKERIFRQLQMEATATPAEANTKDTVDGSNNNESSASTVASDKIQYSHMELLRQAAFGGCIGSITGAVFGFMDGMRTAGDSAVLKNASNMAKGRYLLQGTTRSATTFGVFFGSFHVLKYGFRCTMQPGDYAEIALAAPVALGALAYKPTTRQAMPYATMLIFMDAVNLYMRKTD